MMLKRLLAILLMLLLLLALCSCAARRHIDYGGSEGVLLFERDYYRAGAKVTICFPYIATDTDYFFYLDGEPIQDISYRESLGYIIRFKMPDHDARFTLESRNSMVYIPE